MRKELLILGLSLAALGIPETAMAAKVFDVTLVACSTLNLSVCFRGGGALTLQKGSVEVDDDGKVRLSLKRIEGATAIESQPPYTLGLLFFAVNTTGGVPGISLIGTFTTDEHGSFHGVVGSLSVPTLGFFTVNSSGPGGDFIDFDAEARQQFVTAIPGPTVR